MKAFEWFQKAADLGDEVAMYDLFICYTDNEFYDMIAEETEKNGRPEIVVRTQDKIIIIFGLENTMKEYRYYINTDDYEVHEYKKLEDSTQSLYHQEPYERLKDAIKVLEQ